MLIVIEGLDGSGKGTQAALLAQKLKEQGKRIAKVSFPDYPSQSSALIKMYLAGEFGTHPDDVNAYAASSFYAVDRYASYKKNWEEIYKTGIVVADRYTTSNAIHQCSKLPQNQWDDFLNWLFEYEYQKLNIPQPDIVIYLRVDPEVSQRLLEKRYDGNMEKKDIHEKDREYLLRCQKAADYCSKSLGWKTIECTENRTMRSIEKIADDIKRVLQEIGIQM